MRGQPRRLRGSYTMRLRATSLRSPSCTFAFCNCVECPYRSDLWPLATFIVSPKAGRQTGGRYLVCHVSDRCLTLSVSFSANCVPGLWLMPGLRVMPGLLRPARSSHSYLCYLDAWKNGPERGPGGQSHIPAASQLIHSSVDLILFSALPDRSYRARGFRWVKMRKTRREAPGDSPDAPRARFHSICFA